MACHRGGEVLFDDKIMFIPCEKRLAIPTSVPNHCAAKGSFAATKGLNQKRIGNGGLPRGGEVLFAGKIMFIPYNKDISNTYVCTKLLRGEGDFAVKIRINRLCHFCISDRTVFYSYYPSVCSIAFFGQVLTHLPHSMQRLWSITGKPSASCEMAPTGHALISGHI